MPARSRTQKSGSSTTSARWTPASPGSASVSPPARRLLLRFVQSGHQIDGPGGSARRSRARARPPSGADQPWLLLPGRIWAPRCRRPWPRQRMSDSGITRPPLGVGEPVDDMTRPRPSESAGALGCSGTCRVPESSGQGRIVLSIPHGVRASAPLMPFVPAPADPCGRLSCGSRPDLARHRCRRCVSCRLISPPGPWRRDVAR